ncbi:MAG: tRNA (guanosine(46)-N7)-methyltransferase TrmB [Acidobacteria bacterium]|nr:tRNA (guanosine(46)-N7)-methyltransferase TrmB [Acidobacteriota bacterium]
MFVPDPPTTAHRTTPLLRLAPVAPGRIDFEALFGRRAPVELEVGTGKGRFLLLAASAKPEIDFVGVEYGRTYVETTIERLAKRGVSNVRVAHDEAFHFLRERIADESVAAVHVYFPDPWPKRRHRKRRFLRLEVIDDIARILHEGGLLRVVTDHAEYAQSARALLLAHPCFDDAGSAAALWSLPGMDDYTTVGVTNFEIKYRRQGRPIHRFAFARRPR